jgi:hypothetical protein
MMVLFCPAPIKVRLLLTVILLSVMVIAKNWMVSPLLAAVIADTIVG